MASVLALGISACGSPQSGLSTHDQTAFKRIDGELSTLTQLEGAINADPIAGTRARKHSQYLASEAPLIGQFRQTAQRLQQDVSSLQDRHATELYIPLVQAVDREANDLKLFLSSVIARDRASAKRVYIQLVQDEQQTNTVALEQFPKVRALRSRLNG